MIKLDPYYPSAHVPSSVRSHPRAFVPSTQASADAQGCDRIMCQLPDSSRDSPWILVPQDPLLDSRPTLNLLITLRTSIPASKQKRCKQSDRSRLVNRRAISLTANRRRRAIRYYLSEETVSIKRDQMIIDPQEIRGRVVGNECIHIYTRRARGKVVTR